MTTKSGDGRLQGRVRLLEPMAAHCSWRAGGVVARYFEPHDVGDLETFLSHTSADEPLVWLGLGSNLLVRDGGLEGTVIATHPALATLTRVAEEAFAAGAGVPCARVAKETARARLSGCEFLAGIPGTIGGALAMNAGAFGVEIWDLVTRVETIDRRGQRRIRARAEYTTGYRRVHAYRDEWFISATLQLRRAGEDQAGERIGELLAHRNATQPTGQASCGSVFMNPTGDFAGRLIEFAGLKGCRIGGCHVSEKHANFIINDRGASATDIERLIEHVRATVLERCGVNLVPEVRIIGRAPVRGGGATP